MSEIRIDRYYGSHIRTMRAAVPADALNRKRVIQYQDELIRLCNHHGLNAGALWCQAMHETGGFQSDNWAVNLNPCGLKNQSGLGYASFVNAVDAARAHVYHVAVYVGRQWDGRQWDMPNYRYLDVRAEAAESWVERNGTSETLDDMAKGWAEDPNYANAITARYNQLFDARAITGAKIAVLLVSGHRNRSGGNASEASRTDDLAIAYARSLELRGVRVDWLQEIDGDTDPDYTDGDLASVAIRARSWIESQVGSGAFPVMLDLHFQGGGGSGVFGIVPDAHGDSWDMNFLDRQLAGFVVAGIHEATGLRITDSNVMVPGIMSEKQTGVGSQGYRLGMFNLTASTQPYAVRLVIEHGALDQPEDYRIINDPAFYARAAAGATDGIVGWASRWETEIKAATR